jgi:hypothetical protein
MKNRPDKKCGQCRYLDLNDKHSVGYACRCPHKKFGNTTTAYLKYKSTPACKCFVQKDTEQVLTM